MSKDLNQCNFIGRLGKEVEVKFMPSGKAVVNFNIACSDDYKNKDTGEKVEQTNWINIVMFGRLAEIAGEYLGKGSKVFVSGKLTVRKWQDKQGNDRYTTEIVANEMQMLDGKGGQQSKPQQEPAPQQAGDDFPDDSIPF